MKKVLLALDPSPHSRRAALYAGSVVPHVPGAEVVLFSVLSGIPYAEAELAAGEPAVSPEVHGGEDRSQEVIENRSFLKEMAALLRAAGMPEERMTLVIKPLRRGVAQDILDEAEAGGCDTIILGSRGLSRIQELLQGSISREIVQKAAARAIWVVE